MNRSQEIKHSIRYVCFEMCSTVRIVGGKFRDRIGGVEAPVTSRATRPRLSAGVARLTPSDDMGAPADAEHFISAERRRRSDSVANCSRSFLSSISIREPAAVLFFAHDTRCFLICLSLWFYRASAPSKAGNVWRRASSSSPDGSTCCTR